MKKTILYVLTLTLLLFEVGCSKKDKKESLRDARGRRAGNRNVTDPRSFGGEFSGVISGGSTANGVTTFLSGWMDPQSVGRVDGVWFGGQIATSPRFNPNGTGTYQVDGRSSKIEILIWDEYAGQQDPQSGQIIPGILVDRLQLVDAYVGGGQVDLVFEDDIGWVRFQGSLRGYDVQGSVTFQNYQSFDGYAGGSQGSLGNFYIDACALFICN